MLLALAVMVLEYPAIAVAATMDINPFQTESNEFIGMPVFMLLVVLQWTIISALLSIGYRIVRTRLSAESIHNSDTPHQDA